MGALISCLKHLTVSHLCETFGHTPHSQLSRIITTTFLDCTSPADISALPLSARIRSRFLYHSCDTHARHRLQILPGKRKVPELPTSSVLCMYVFPDKSSDTSQHFHSLQTMGSKVGSDGSFDGINKLPGAERLSRRKVTCGARNE